MEFAEESDKFFGREIGSGFEEVDYFAAVQEFFDAFPSAEPARASDVYVEYAAKTTHVADDALVLLDVLVAQLLAFFRCMEMGLKPDEPSSDGIINRVVGDFAIHRR